jgi:hypothetical protein
MNIIIKVKNFALKFIGTCISHFWSVLQQQIIELPEKLEPKCHNSLSLTLRNQFGHYLWMLHAFKKYLLISDTKLHIIHTTTFNLGFVAHFFFPNGLITL